MPITRTRAALAAAIIVPVLSALSACSASVSAGSDDEYDAESVAQMVQDQQQKVTPDLDVADASCPEGVDLKVGEEFRCTVSVAGVEAPYTVTITEVGDTSAHYELAPAKAIIGVDAVIAFLRDQAQAQGLADAEIDCGPEKILVADPQTTFDCTLSTATADQVVTVLIEDLEGNVSLQSVS
jgi:hypothetical protein